MSIAGGRLELPAGTITCALDSVGAGTLFLCAHGAGGSYADAAIRAVSGVLQAAGLDVLRFNFPYREHKSARPDPMPVLTDCIAAVADVARREIAPRRIILGGRSMGGRAASMLAAGGFPCDGLLLLAYPLHPPGRTDKLRVAHLSSITTPVLCFNGTRDTFCEQELMDEAVAHVRTRWTMHWLEGADHSFHVPRKSGRTDTDVLEEVTQASATWLRSLDR